MEPMKDSRSRSRQSAAYIAMLPFWLALDRKFIQKSREDWAVNGLRSLYGDGFFTRADCETHRLNGE
jgi:hypothetical protein